MGSKTTFLLHILHTFYQCVADPDLDCGLWIVTFWASGSEFWPLKYPDPNTATLLKSISFVLKSIFIIHFRRLLIRYPDCVFWCQIQTRNTAFDILSNFLQSKIFPFFHTGNMYRVNFFSKICSLMINIFIFLYL